MRLATTFGKDRRELRSERGEFLSEDEMRARLPAIFAQDAHHSRSERYAYVPTIDILRGLAGEGFKPVFACQASPRDEDRTGHTKHMIRFRRPGDIERAEVPEVVMVNSHGGESSVQLFGGFFRFICCNGMVCGETLGEVRVRHSGRVVGDVIEGTYQVVESLAPVVERVAEMKAIPLSNAEQMAFAHSAAVLRLDPDEGEAPAISDSQFLRARRSADSGSDLWSTFNRIQENTIRGGLHGERRDALNRRRRVTTREVRGIDQNVALNRALWTLAEKMAEIKRGH